MAVKTSLVSCLVFSFLTVFSCVAAIEDYCSVNTYGSNSTYMQFTKEPSSKEFAISGTFKGLHCCAKGYRSIEWYKDGKKYPWPLMSSQLILYPESANQTIYTQDVKVGDSGNYTCLLRNDTVVQTHTIYLQVFENEPDEPHITYISPDFHVHLGGSVRLFCEAFAGNVDLPDALNEIIWQKIGTNSSIENMSHIRQEKTSREDGRTFGTYLIIEGIKASDFGEYICRIKTPGKSFLKNVVLFEKHDIEYTSPNPFPVEKVFLWCTAIFLIGLTVIILNLRFGLAFRVYMKDRYCKLEDNDGKENDVLIVYSAKDTEVALGVLLPTLESKYGYKCASKELPNSINTWYSYLQSSSQKSRRIVAIVSPELLSNVWNPSSLYMAIKQLQSLCPKLTCILLKELPSTSNEVKNSQGETLSSLVRSVHVVEWNLPNTEKFWLFLRLRLPPKRTDCDANRTVQGVNSSRLNHFHEHLDDLV